MSIADALISIIIVATIFVVIFFSILEFYKLYLAELGSLTAEEVLYTVSLTVIFVKAYKMLQYYLDHHHISVKYIVEISIIAPVVEIIFAPDARSLSMNILFAVISIAMLIVYLVFYDKLARVDEKEQFVDSGKSLSEKNANS